MAHFRHTSFLVIAAILVWVVYYSQSSTSLSQSPELRRYESHIHTDEEIDSILVADATATGTAQLKHHESVSANRYDTANRKQRTKSGNEKSTDLVDANGYPKMKQQSGNGKEAAGKGGAGGRASQKTRKVKSYSETFPKQVWQYSSQADRTANKDKSQKWADVNKDLECLWLSDIKADHFVHEMFSQSRKSLVKVWDELATGYEISPTLAIVRSNLLRYLVLLVQGGMYTDIDTVPLIHANHYIPLHLANKHIDAIVGLDFDVKGSVGFLTSTMVSNTYHPLFVQAVERVISNLEYLKHSHGVSTLAQLKLSNAEADAATGPSMFTDVVLRVLQEQTPKKTINAKYFLDMSEPRLLGNVLVLPIGAFNAKHKLDPYGGEMIGLQGTRLVMRSDDTEATSTSSNQNLDIKQHKLPMKDSGALPLTRTSSSTTSTSPPSTIAAWTSASSTETAFTVDITAVEEPKVHRAQD